MTDSTTANAEPKTVVKPASSGSSWEDIANEVVPADMTMTGLATGARRGPSRPYPGAPRDASKAWLPVPVQPRAIECPLYAPDADFSAVLRGVEKTDKKQGTHYFISHPATAYDPDFASFSVDLQRALKQATHPALSGARVEDLLFVDIETTGLSSDGPLFLIGALRLDGEPRLDLFLARNYREEAAVLAAFQNLAAGKVIITFNGKSFDWPYIKNRSQVHKVKHATPSAHFDLLHHARRTWKHQVPNCKLQTLELYLCGRTRRDDVPSSQIPARYEEFVELYSTSGRGAHLLAPVIHHNALDILTMAQLLGLSGEKDK
ncbi:MAG: ribonuclease H-like domain-containing protein [Abitibacteriaceae bacterium]|nr:ribonuclease H-like domain-containing protein [Abditibacteriaceae bacterium]